MSSFWTSTALEPKRQFRFRLTITAVDGQAAIWYAKKVTVPAFTVGEVKIKQRTSQIQKYLNTGWPDSSYELFYYKLDDINNENGLIYFDKNNIFKFSEPKININKSKSDYTKWFNIYLKINLISNLPIDTLCSLSKDFNKNEILNEINLINICKKIKIKEIFNLLG